MSDIITIDTAMDSHWSAAEATMELRWATGKGHVVPDNGVMLQQKWKIITARGVSFEWRTIPTVNLASANDKD